MTPAGAEGVDAGWLPGALQMPSPNCDERPPDEVVRLVVIHAISLPPGEFGGPGIIDLFSNRLDPEAHPYFRELRGLRVSSHFLVRRDGTLIQFVPCSRRAWHAGVSNFEGRANCNDFSIGIELEGLEGDSFEADQYATLSVLCAAITARSRRDARPIPDRISTGIG